MTEPWCRTFFNHRRWSCQFFEWRNIPFVSKSVVVASDDLQHIGFSEPCFLRLRPINFSTWFLSFWWAAMFFQSFLAWLLCICSGCILTILMLNPAHLEQSLVLPIAILIPCYHQNFLKTRRLVSDPLCSNNLPLFDDDQLKH
jgi:hypothetical protein